MLGRDIIEPETCIMADGSTKSETVFNDKLKVSYNDVTDTLEITLKGILRPAEISQGCQLVEQLVMRHNPVKWLLDLHNTVRIKRSDRRWAFTEFFPEMLRMAGKDIFMAIILPVYSSHELVQELDGDELMQNGNFMIINHFLYKKEAERWLEKYKAVNAALE